VGRVAAVQVAQVPEVWDPRGVGSLRWGPKGHVEGPEGGAVPLRRDCGWNWSHDLSYRWGDDGGRSRSHALGRSSESSTDGFGNGPTPGCGASGRPGPTAAGTRWASSFACLSCCQLWLPGRGRTA